MPRNAQFGTTVDETEVEMTPEMVAEILSMPPEFEEIAALRQNYAVQEYTLLEILTAEETGQMATDAADDLAAQAIEDHADNQAEILGLEPVIVEESEEVEEVADYNRNNQTAQFAAAFGEVVGALIEDEFENADDGIEEIAAASGLAPEAIVGVISGQLAPDLSGGVDVLDQMASVFDNLQQDERAYQEFVQLGTQAYEQVVGGSAQMAPPTAAMSSADHTLRAEFAALQEREMVGESLRNLERECDRGCSEAWLTPNEARILMGRFEERSDRTAAFSQACEMTNTPPTTQLDRIQYYLYVAEQRGNVALFNNAIDTTIDLEVETSQEDNQAAEDYRSRNGYH